MIHLLCDWCARKAQWYPPAPLPDGWVAIGVQHFCGSTCLALYLERAGVQATPVEDPSLVRPVDVPVLIGDSHKLQRATGWSATRALDDIIDDLLHAATL